VTQGLRIVCGPIVRRTSSTSATLWVEVDEDCILHARASPIRGPASQPRTPAGNPARPPQAVSPADFTVKVGGRFYALLTLRNLAPGWVYVYELWSRPTLGKKNRAFTDRDPNAGYWWPADLQSRAITGKRPSFRTFPIEKTEDMRIAFGSCRKLGGGFRGTKQVGEEDVLPLFGQHLQATANGRLTTWPHLLLLLGDQIYADNVDRQVVAERLRAPGRGGKVLGTLDAPESILDWERDRRPGETKNLGLRVFGRQVTPDIRDLQEYAGAGSFQCLEFHDFAALYVAAWTEPQVARVFANLPTFMIFDDHEIADAWNLTGGWIKQMKQSPAWIKAVTEGLVAYWMYQGWGNPTPPGGRDARWTIPEKAAADGTDALDGLQKWFATRLPGSGRAAYYYEIELSPPILVLDTRNDRTFVAPKQRGPNNVTVHADSDDEILSEEQWRWLQGRIDQKGPLVLASSVPLLQLLCADVWLLRATRPLGPGIASIEEDDQTHADIWEFYRRDIGTDQWTAFPKSFAKLARELFGRGPFVFLSGDVHYAYAMYGRASVPEVCRLGRNPLMLHAVSSPLRNQWSDKDLKKNDPEQCSGMATPASMIESAKNTIIHNIRKGAAAPCDFLEDGEHLRLFLPDALPAFNIGPKKTRWTHLNNIGILHLWKDGTSVKVSWLGVSTKKGESLREIGSIAYRLGEFFR
jgi:hypothetical protein